MSIGVVYNERTRLTVLIYHSLAPPSGPVPALGTYSSVARTPIPTNEGAARIVGQEAAYGTYERLPVEQTKDTLTSPINCVPNTTSMLLLTRYVPEASQRDWSNRLRQAALPLGKYTIAFWVVEP